MRKRAHPRVRGDDVLVPGVDTADCGSPPRARGRRRSPARVWSEAGLTPACAGTTAAAPPSHGQVRAHPRVRGDDDELATRALADDWPTPACAGTTRSFRFLSAGAGAHPRVRGDDPSAAPRPVVVLGSPPRARGRRIAAPDPVRPAGLTPACAGTTRPPPCPPTPPWAHPRVRGDDSRRWMRPVCGGGSPPRARGRRVDRGQEGSGQLAHPRVRGDDKRALDPDPVQSGSPPRARGRRRLRGGADGLVGLTPACAGTTCRFARRCPRTRAHPRVRGDDSGAISRGARRFGSPPRARGRLGGAAPLPRVGGLTPACAGTTAESPGRRGRTAAHPRVRGDDPQPAARALSARGSPPRARGRLGPGVQAGRLLGLTPACAGTTRSLSSLKAARRAHPRVRGDDAGVLLIGGEWVGSPPRARGRRAHVGVGPVAARLTPACAGTTPAPSPRGPYPGAHPRVRGDDEMSTASARPPPGSPPRARGRHPGGTRGLMGRGLTPACAGTTRPRSSARPSATAHPRVRGDDSAALSRSTTPCGSPPRARGRRSGYVSVAGSLGLTPACAGTTPARAHPGRPPSAHPRVRGDDAPSRPLGLRARGSPPRARGRRAGLVDELAGGRLTPACAGTTGAPSPTRTPAEAHPRVRGDDDLMRVGRPGERGSPPRARGRPPLRAADRRRQGLTPACAGTTSTRSGSISG